MTGTKAYGCYVQVTETFGKAPLCSGDCPEGWTRQGASDVGENGQPCITGKGPFAPSRSTSHGSLNHAAARHDGARTHAQGDRVSRIRLLYAAKAPYVEVITAEPV
jgi:hypothetical protein